MLEEQDPSIGIDQSDSRRVPPLYAHMLILQQLLASRRPDGGQSIAIMTTPPCR